jgi:hypothetical protein
MPRRQLLSPQARSALFDPPSEPTAIARLYTLSADDLTRVRRRRRPQNRLSFAVQLTYLRHPGRALGVGEEPPAAMLAHIAGQVGTDPALFADYARRDETRREHLVELQAALGMASFGMPTIAPCGASRSRSPAGLIGATPSPRPSWRSCGRAASCCPRRRWSSASAWPPAPGLAPPPMPTW